jgi:hypothetical protein
MGAQKAWFFVLVVMVGALFAESWCPQLAIGAQKSVVFLCGRYL